MNILQRLLWIVLWACLALFSACDRQSDALVDKLNETSYAWHSEGYSAGAVEALNNLAFVDIARMRYRQAHENLSLIEKMTDNQIELLVADIQQMRLCQ